MRQADPALFLECLTYAFNDLWMSFEENNSFPSPPASQPESLKAWPASHLGSPAPT